jgi:hypothetical protein
MPVDALMIDRAIGASCFPRVKSNVMVAAGAADGMAANPAGSAGLAASRAGCGAGLVGYGG